MPNIFITQSKVILTHQINVSQSFTTSYYSTNVSLSLFLFSYNTSVFSTDFNMIDDVFISDFIANKLED